MSTIILLSRGLVALVDDADAERVSSFKWHAVPSKQSAQRYYARRSCDFGGRAGLLYLHRFILAVDDDMTVDHIDGDGLNNRRANLRVATRSQNNANRDAPVGPSGYRGVAIAPSGRFRASITAGRQNINLGRYDTAELAAQAYDAAAIQYFGDFARLNFPPQAIAQRKARAAA